MEKPFVLLADDNEGTRTLIRALLKPEFEVEVATDGQEAIERLKSRRYAAILLDLLMPVTDGFSVLDFLTAEHPELLTRVIVVTAVISERELARVRTYSAGALILKPFEIDVLVATVRQISGHDPLLPLPGTLLTTGMLLLLADLLR